MEMSTVTVSPKQISELRARTGAGMMDSKAALQEAGGDMDKAAEILRKKGIAKAETRGGRTASQGLVVISAENLGTDLAMIELDCETDFVARTEGFIHMARELGVHAASQAPLGVHPGSALDGQPFGNSTVAESVKELSGKTGEATTLKRVAHFRQEQGSVQGYLHHNSQVGVLIELSGTPGEVLDALGRELALHIASTDPLAISEADLPVEIVEREKRIAEEQVASEGKPEQIRPKIVAGKVRKFIAERTLLGQPFVKDESKTAGDLVQEASKTLGAPVKVNRFVRFKVGEA
jgi:elongation factor Ts